MPLKKNGGILTVGFGDGGMPPFAYFLRSGQDLDVGFLKLFLSTKYVDLSNIPQLSPFDEARSVADEEKPEIDTWGTLLVPVLQRRYPPPIEGQTHCPRCGFDALPSTITIRRLHEDNETLRCEIDIIHGNALIEQSRIENHYATLRFDLETAQAEVARLTAILESPDQITDHAQMLSSDVQEEQGAMHELSIKREITRKSEEHVTSPKTSPSAPKTPLLGKSKSLQLWVKKGIKKLIDLHVHGS